MGVLKLDCFPSEESHYFFKSNERGWTSVVMFGACLHIKRGRIVGKDSLLLAREGSYWQQEPFLRKMGHSTAGMFEFEESLVDLLNGKQGLRIPFGQRMEVQSVLPLRLLPRLHGGQSFLQNNHGKALKGHSLDSFQSYRQVQILFRSYHSLENYKVK
jgi:hypothetical protein